MHEHGRIRWWLLACGVVMLLTGVLHTLAGLQEPAPETAEQIELMAVMKRVKLGLPGSPDRTMSELAQGFSWLMSVLCISVGAAALVTAARIRRGPGVGSATWIVVLSLAASTAISLRFFFAVPTACFGLALLLGVVSLLLDGRAPRSRGVMPGSM